MDKKHTVRSVYIPDWMEAELQLYPDLNFSRICQNAIREELKKRKNPHRKWDERLAEVERINE